MSEDILTFEQLSEIERKERKDDTLAEMPEDFYQQVADYLERKDQIAGDDRSEFRKIKHVLEDIIDSRQKKLLKLAFLASRTDFRAENVLPEEEQFMADIRERITAHRDHLEQIVLPGRDKGDESDGAGTADAGSDEGSDTDAEDSDEDAGDDDSDEDHADTGDGTDDSTTDTDDTPAAGDDDEELSGETGDDTADAQDDDEDDEILFGGGSGSGSDAPDGEAADTDGNDHDDTTVDEDADDQDGAADDDGIDTSPGDGTERGTNGMVMLIATEDIGAFMGVDLEEYGPFEEGDEIQVPADNADALLEDDRAEKI